MYTGLTISRRGETAGERPLLNFSYSACLLKRLGRVLLPLRFQPSRPLLIGLWLYNGLIVVMVVMVF
jgi:hypothetical protein